MEIIVYISLAFLMASCVAAVMSRSLLRSAIWLAFASAVLGVIMYALGAVWAAVIEVSACSGLVTIIFISAISLSNMKRNEVHKMYDDHKRMRLLPLALIVLGLGLVVLALVNDFTIKSEAVKVAEDFREIFWNTRQADIFGQVITILIGGISIFVLFRDEETKPIDSHHQG